MAEGFGPKRRPVMYNDLVIVGPVADPARIAASGGPFISRGDRSATRMCGPGPGRG